MIKYFLADETRHFRQATEGSSGFDVAADLPDQVAYIYPGDRVMIPTGLHLEMPDGVEAQVRGRSGLTMRHGVAPLLGTIDSDYRGEVSICLFNHGDAIYQVNDRDRIAQIVFCPILPQFFENMMAMVEQGMKMHMTVKRVPRVEMLSPTLRGGSGHGSTGF